MIPRCGWSEAMLMVASTDKKRAVHRNPEQVSGKRKMFEDHFRNRTCDGNPVKKTYRLSAKRLHSQSSAGTETKAYTRSVSIWNQIDVRHLVIKLETRDLHVIPHPRSQIPYLIRDSVKERFEAPAPPAFHRLPACTCDALEHV